MLEVLSPAGSIDSFFSAINNGADAVYLGLSKFNARAKSQDFNLANIREYVKIAHLFGVRVYVTLNTIVTQNEFNEIICLVKKAVEAKVDAFIVQDFGVAKLLRQSFKNIVLHASTQMGIHNLEGANVAEQLGFKRIVLSRETTLEDIKQISTNTNLEIEYFVQGALCVGFSGACYFSSLKHNKSGNRGECLQLCRLCYSAQGKGANKKGYFLSPADLCFVDNLQTLAEAGVTSFKIEGRLRRPSYVAVATRAYAQAKRRLENILQKNDNVAHLKHQLQKVFFRGEYNNGLYLSGVPSEKIINPNFQNHRGVLIGEVVSVSPFKDIFEIVVQTTEYQINKNDGLKFVDKTGFETSLGVGSVKKNERTKNSFSIFSKVKPKQNSKVFLTVDSVWEESLLKTKRKLAFDAFFEGQVGKAPVLTLKCGEVEITECLSDALCQEAKTQGLTIEELRRVLEKTQDTYFCLKDLTANLESIFLPKSQLNELRRRAINTLFEAVVKTFEQKNCPEVCFDQKICQALIDAKCDSKHFCEHVENKSAAKKDLIGNGEGVCNFVVVDENSSWQDVERAKVDLKKLCVVISPSVFNVKTVLEMINKWKAFKPTKIFLDLPRVLSSFNKPLLQAILKALPKETGLVANNIYGLSFAKDRRVIGGASLNIANCLSGQVLSEFNVKTFVKSFEPFAESFDGGVSFEGKSALMTFCHCPYKTVYKNCKCADCNFDGALGYISQDGCQYNIRRIKLNSCLFELVDCKKITANFGPKFIDLRQ